MRIAGGGGMGKIIGWIEHAAAIGALGIVTWTVIEIVKAYAGWWPAMIFAVCILVVGLSPAREARDD